MAVETILNRKVTTGNGVTTAFPTTFQFLLAADLVVIETVISTGVATTKAITTHYTVSGGAGLVGTVNMLVAPSALVTLTVYNSPAITQGLDLLEGDVSPAESKEAAWDRLTYIAQRLSDRLDRSVRLAEGFSATFSLILPAVLTADAVLTVDPSSTGLVMGPTIGAITTAAANAAAALASANASEISNLASGVSATASAASATASAASATASEVSNLASAAAAAAAVATHAALTVTHGATGAVVGTTNSQVLTNKTLTTPVIDVASLTEQGSTPSTPASGTARLYAKSDGLYRLNSAGTEQRIGSGGGGINYMADISSNDAESSVGNWVAYKDAAGALPVDGVDGTINTTITRVASTTLRGTGLFRLTKLTGASRQGEGVSCPFTIADADKAKMLDISFDYLPSAGIVAGSDSATGDINVYIYDLTNAVLIQPTPFKLPGGSTLSTLYSGTFQTASNSTSYRLIVHIAGTTDAAATFDFDNVVVGPRILVQGVRAKAYGATTSIPNAATTTVVNPTKKFDTHGAYSTTTGLFTAPRSGFVRVTVAVSASSASGTGAINNAALLQTNKNGSTDSFIDCFVAEQTGTALTRRLSGSTIIQVIAGDTVGVQINNIDSAFTCGGTEVGTWVCFEME